MKTIENLNFLKFHGVPSIENVSPEYERIATALMNDWILQSVANQYRITELEFYLKNSTHPDHYTHGHKLQKKFGSWYFHGSGLDITFGGNDYFGSILIRAIYNIATGEYVYGPINAVTELFKNIDNVCHQSFSFGLVRDHKKIINREKPIAAPRIGLNKTNDPAMEKELYRFIVMPKKRHDEKTRIAEAMKLQGYSESKIKEIWG